MTLNATARGHEPDSCPSLCLRMKVWPLPASPPVPTSRIEPSSAPSIAVVLETIQSRIGCISVFDATTWPSSERNWSAAIRRLGSGTSTSRALSATAASGVGVGGGITMQHGV